MPRPPQRAFLVASWSYAPVVASFGLCLWLLSVAQQLSQGGESRTTFPQAALIAGWSSARVVLGWAGLWGIAWLLHKRFRTAPVALLWIATCYLIALSGFSIWGFFATIDPSR